MVKKRVDNRVKILIENAVALHHRCFFVLVGDKGREQVVNLHYILSKTLQQGKRPSVLWCYKRDLGFSSHYQKRMRQLKKQIAKGLREADEDDPFELFVSSTKIRYTYYKDSANILGQTFGMCILQDFEALTPNLLARTIETVEGGGIVVLLLKTMSSLEELYSLSMDVHQRFRTTAHQNVVGRFNERFLLSLSRCESCLVCDDELNVLPVSSHIRKIKPVGERGDDSGDGDDDGEGRRRREKEEASRIRGTDLRTKDQRQLDALRETMAGCEPASTLLKVTCTVDQAKAVMTFIDAIGETTLRSTVALTAARGRGKSAALGLVIAGAIALGYSNVFVTSPHPDNLKTLFEFVFRGFDALGFVEHQDYELVQSTNPQFNDAVVRVNVFRSHRQTVQYIQPQDASVLGQAELLVIDEAAAIPLPIVRKLLGPYLVFMASTVNGYEGTGRSLSLKLIKQLREQAAVTRTRLRQQQTQASGVSTVTASASASSSSSGKQRGREATGIAGRTLKEVTLATPIRYASEDPIEAWLNALLCFDATLVKRLPGGCPAPDKCELYCVNRDTLFSYHDGAEEFLQRLVGLFVSSHYKNAPNDLLLMSDAPAHRLFVLLGPIDRTKNELPEILCAVQVCLEGQIGKRIVREYTSQGRRASGDLIPWTLAQQFQDELFPGLSGARVVRIATHPVYQRMGYASRALDQLMHYYQGDFPFMADDDDEEDEDEDDADDEDEEAKQSSAGLFKRLQRRKHLPNLLSQLTERKAERLHWLGVSYGLTLPLYRFWKKAAFEPMYVRLTANDTTGEHTCIMLRHLNTTGSNLDISLPSHWLATFAAEFRRRFVALLGYDFQTLPLSLALMVVGGTFHAGHQVAATAETDRAVAATTGVPTQVAASLEKVRAVLHFNDFDFKRLQAYARNLLDFHGVLDLVPSLCRALFLTDLAMQFRLSATQQAILLGLGLQHRSLNSIADDLSLQHSQVLAQFSKVVSKVAHFSRRLHEQEVEATLPSRAEQTERTKHLKALEGSLQDDLDGGSSSSNKRRGRGAVATPAAVDSKKAEAARRAVEDAFGEGLAVTDDRWSSLSSTVGEMQSVPGSVAIRKLNENVGAAVKRRREEKATQAVSKTNFKKSKRKGGKGKRR